MSTRFAAMRETARCAFDLGVTHFDLANNYGPPPGSAENQLRPPAARGTLRRNRDELIISTKAGYRMGPGPYGDGGSRKYLFASLDQSLQRLGFGPRRHLLPPPPRTPTRRWKRR